MLFIRGGAVGGWRCPLGDGAGSGVSRWSPEDAAVQAREDSDPGFAAGAQWSSRVKGIIRSEDRHDHYAPCPGLLSAF
jgi:hypothetical protein